MPDPVLADLSVVVAQTIELEDSGPNWGQVVVGIAVLLAVIAAAAVQMLRGKRAGKAPEQTRHERIIRGQLANLPTRLTLIAREMGQAARRRHLEAVLPGIRGLNPGVKTDEPASNPAVADGGRGDGPDEAGERETVTEPEITTVPTARTALGRTLRAPIAALPDLPPLVGRLVGEAVAMFVLGSILFVGISTWREELHRNPTALDVPSTDAVGSAVGTVIDLLVSVLALFPFGQWVWRIYITAFVNVGRWLFANWLAVGILLLLGAALLAVLEYLLGDVTEDVSVTDIAGLRTVFGGGLWVGGAVLLTGIGFAAVGHAIAWIVGQAVPWQWVGQSARLLADIGAFLMASGVGVWFTREALRRTRFRARSALQTAARQGARDRQLLALLLAARGAFGLLSIAVAPILLVYFIQALTSGRLGTILGLIWTAPLVTKAALLFFLGTLAVLVVLRAHQDLLEVGSLWALVTGQKAISLVVFLSLGPVIVGIVLALSVFVLGAPGVVAILLGLFTMVTLRLTGVMVTRGKQYAHARRAGKEQTLPTRCYVDGYELEDADGRSIHALRFGAGLIVAHRDPHALVDTGLELLDHYFQHNEWPTSVAELYWENCREGLVEWSHSEQMARQEAKRSIKGYLQEHGNRMHRRTLLDKLENDDLFDHVTQMYDVQHPKFDGWEPEQDGVVEEMLRYGATRGNWLDIRQGGDILVLTD